METAPDSIDKTLIIRFSSIGDIVLSSLLCRILRQRFPQSEIDYLVKAEHADLVRYNPHITRVIEFPANGGIRNLLKLRQSIHTAKYDLIVDAHDSLRSRFLCWGLRGVVRLRKHKIARFLLVKFKINLYKSLGYAQGVAERYIEPVSSLGVADDDNGLEIFVHKESLNTAERFLRTWASGDTFIGICPSAKHSNKMWLKERFAETAAVLAREAGEGVMLFGSRDEHGRCMDIEEWIHEKCREIPVFNLAGRTSLLETAALMDHCSIVITNDSGLMHIAAARKRKVVAIFGPTVKELGFFPYGTLSTVIEHESLRCRPCTHIGLPHCPKGHFKCMNEIPASRVIDAARQLLKVKGTVGVIE